MSKKPGWCQEGSPVVCNGAGEGVEGRYRGRLIIEKEPSEFGNSRVGGVGRNRRRL